ncbi:MAG: hypothetical protein UW09_C0001G0002 [candidate division TM6 bacterium GW2011_GWF2_43_87]|nr:MAG: hypothetical protein UW09_C0001G0002 [candidate division TM6 bacterium GW2011_GWF2_43_87]
MISQALKFFLSLECAIQSHNFSLLSVEELFWPQIQAFPLACSNLFKLDYDAQFCFIFGGKHDIPFGKLRVNFSSHAALLL